MKILYLDESGDHSLTKIDPQYPVFVLGGVIVNGVRARKSVDLRLTELKRSFFDQEDLVLHSSDIIRARNGFEKLANPRLRIEFYQALNGLMRELDYQVVACVIKKDEHLVRYGVDAIDPYVLGLRVLVERFCQEIGSTHDGGMICAERRGPELDAELESAWMGIVRTGTPFKRAGEISNRIVDLSLKDERLNIGGLQLADLFVSPIGRVAVGKTTGDDWEIIKSKLRRGRGGYEGHGLVVLPKSP